MKKCRSGSCYAFLPACIVISFSCEIDSHEQWRKWNYHPVVVSVKDLGNGIILLTNEGSARLAFFLGSENRLCRAWTIWLAVFELKSALGLAKRLLVHSRLERTQANRFHENNFSSEEARD
jgi:hypothetical protein